MRGPSEPCGVYLEKCVPCSTLPQEPREEETGLSSDGAGSVSGGCCELFAGETPQSFHSFSRSSFRGRQGSTL